MGSASPSGGKSDASDKLLGLRRPDLFCETQGLDLGPLPGGKLGANGIGGSKVLGNGYSFDLGCVGELGLPSEGKVNGPPAKLQARIVVRQDPYCMTLRNRDKCRAVIVRKATDTL